jgi:hypothetical protein
MKTGSSHEGRATPWYRAEPWLAVAVTAFVPVILALVVPAQLKGALAGVAGALMLWSLWLLMRRGAPRREDER